MCGQASLEWIKFTVEKSEFGFLSIKMAKCCTFGLIFLKTMKIYLLKVFCLDCKVLYLTNLTVLHVISVLNSLRKLNPLNIKRGKFCL